MVCINLKSFTCCLCVLVLLHDVSIVQAMGRSPVVHMDHLPQNMHEKASLRGLGFHAPQLSWAISLPEWFWKAAPATQGTSRLRGAFHNGNNHKGPFELASLYWRRALKMPTFITEAGIMSSYPQIWALLMSLALVVWLVQTVRYGLKSLHNFKDPLQNPVQLIKKELQESKKASRHFEQMNLEVQNCLISELECAVREGGARLPQSSQKDKKIVTSDKVCMTKFEQARELKAFGPYFEVAGES